MATQYPIFDKQPSSPPESGRMPKQAIVEDARKATEGAIHREDIPTELDRKVLAHRLDVDQLDIAGLSLRPNQLRAIQALRGFLLETNNDTGYFIQPTGAGKTFTFGLIAKLTDIPTLVLVPTNQLLNQTKSEFVKALDFQEDEVGVIQSGKPVPKNKKVLISTYSSHVSRLKHDKGSFDKEYKRAVIDSPLVICDEAHRALGEKTSESIGLTPEEEKDQENALENLETHTSAQAIKLGFTATPDLSQKSVARFFRTLIAQESFHEMREAGILVPHKSHLIIAKCGKAIIKDRISTTQEGKILRNHQMYPKMLARWKEIEKQEKEETGKEKPLRTIVFCANVIECEKWEEKAQALGLKCRIVTHKQPDEAVGEATEELLQGKIDQIITVNKLAEGFDCRPINCVMIARATNSPVKVAQPIGRGLRVQTKEEDKTHGEKKYCHLIEGQFIISPSREVSETGTKEKDDEDDEVLVDGEEWDEDELEKERNKRIFKGQGALTMTFDEYLQINEGVSGEAEGSEVKDVKILRFNEEGIAHIGGKTLVIPEVFVQNLPYIQVDTILEDVDFNPIELNPNFCRFGDIPVQEAYDFSDIRRQILEYYNTNLHISEEGIGIFVEARETMLKKELVGTEVVTIDYIRKRLEGFITEEMDDEEVRRILSAHGEQNLILPKGMKIHGVDKFHLKSIYYKETIDKLKEELTAPKSEEENGKGSFSIPEDRNSNIDITLHFEGGEDLSLLRFGPRLVLRRMIERIKETVEANTNDKATLKFILDKLFDYENKVTNQGMVSARGARMSDAVVNAEVLDPIFDITTQIEKMLG